MKLPFFPSTFPICLSRACLGKMFVFRYKWLNRTLPLNLLLPRVVPVTRGGELLLDSNSSVVMIVFIAICLPPPRTPPQEIESTLLHTSAVLNKKRFPFIISHHPY